MPGGLAEFFASDTYLPGAQCYHWQGLLLWTQVVSNTLIGRSALTNNGVISLDDSANVQLNTTLTNNGQLSIGVGLMSLTGSATMSPSSVLRYRGIAPGIMGRFTMLGNLTLAGSIIADFTWSPPVGSEYDILVPTSHTGSASVSATGLPAGRTVTFSFVNLAGKLRVVTLI